MNDAATQDQTITLENTCDASFTAGDFVIRWTIPGETTEHAAATIAGTLDGSGSVSFKPGRDVAPLGIVSDEQNAAAGVGLFTPGASDPFHSVIYGNVNSDGLTIHDGSVARQPDIFSPAAGVWLVRDASGWIFGDDQPSAYMRLEPAESIVWGKLEI